MAIAILGLALGTLLSLHTGYLSSAIRDKNTTRAALYAKQLMTIIETAELPPDPGTLERELFDVLKDGDLLRDDDNESELERQLEGWQYMRTVTQIDLPEFEDAMRRIDLTISWGEEAREQYTVVYFMRSQPE